MTTGRPDTVLIERRFCGPPESGNGGYVAGLLAQFLGSGPVAVRLRVPPPLERHLEVRPTDTGVSLLDGDTLVAEARATDVKLEPLDPPKYQEAEAGSRQYRGFHSHWFPSCFVCGPNRDPHDGLCIFPGPIDGQSLVAAPWAPDPSLAAASGSIRPEFLWAALDCPGAFAFPEPDDGVVLLGELHVELFGPVSVGERCVLAAQELAHDGRKHRTATALFGESGSCRGVGLGIWFEVPRSPPTGAA
jgi:hypothetical protein